MSEQTEQGLVKVEPTLPRRLVGAEDVASYIGLSIHTVYTMVSQHRIPYVKVGRLTKFDVRAIDAWIRIRSYRFARKGSKNL